jgi:hypothetical protein
MKEINSYIIEKLKINKDSKINNDLYSKFGKTIEGYIRGYTGYEFDIHKRPNSEDDEIIIEFKIHLTEAYLEEIAQEVVKYIKKTTKAELVWGIDKDNSSIFIAEF